MTEAEWRVCTSPKRMLAVLRGKASDRKLRLFAIACWVHSVHFHGTFRERQTIPILQSFAEGEHQREMVQYLVGKPEWATLAESAWDAATLWANQTFHPDQMVREIFGNPFRPTPGTVSWRSSVAVHIAEGIYAEDSFDHRLPILADALEDAGCTDSKVVEHCRGDGTHVRGCWVVDLILGRQ